LLRSFGVDHLNNQRVRTWGPAAHHVWTWQYDARGCWPCVCTCVCT
jgi:hypothetical protein